MKNIPKKQFSPNYAVPPGETLEEVLQEIPMSQAELAKRTGLTRKTINQITKGNSPITVETALLLEKTLDFPAHFWLNLETQFAEHQAREARSKELSTDLQWVTKFPVKELVSRCYMEDSNSKNELLENLLKFFGVASRTQWEDIWSRWEVNYRKTEAYSRKKEHVAAWIRCGEMSAKNISCEEYSAKKFKAKLEELRELTVLKFKDAKPKIQELCSESGVAAVFEPEFKDTKLSGAAYWSSPKKAVIQLSLRGKKDDLFWFTFFHEACHILNHSKKDQYKDEVFTDGDQHSKNNKIELEADEFSANHLIPEKDFEDFVFSGDFSRSAITAFARKQNIAPGIVLGRLQNGGLVLWATTLNSMKEKYDF